MLGEAVQYRDVEALDEDFKSFVAALPRAFRMNDPDRSWDKSKRTRPKFPLMPELWFLPVHRYYIQTEILHFTIILHVSSCHLIQLTKASLAVEEVAKQPLRAV